MAEKEETKGSTFSGNKSANAGSFKSASTMNVVPRVGIQGVRLKKFEQVVADILPHPECVPRYFPLPSLPSQSDRDLISLAVKTNSIFQEKVDNPELHYKDDFDGDVKKKNDQTKFQNPTPPPEWPFSAIPQDAGVRESSRDKNRSSGKLAGMRAVKKEWQLRSLIQCVLAMLPSSSLGRKDEDEDEHSESRVKRIKIIDFAGGTGHLALPLAVLLPKCDVILVDLKAASLELAHQKAEELCSPPPPIIPPLPSTASIREECNEVNDQEDANINKNEGIQKKSKKKKKKRPKPPSTHTEIDVTQHTNVLRQSKHLPNLYSYHGSISTYAEQHDNFDIGLALHACGEATDLVLRACGVAKANFIVSPCCVGKLNQKKNNPYIYAANRHNEATITYPQSSAFCTIISPKIGDGGKNDNGNVDDKNASNDDFDYLAKAADYSEMEDMRTARNATRRTAKALLEMDRLLFMKETYGYDHVILSRMTPWEASPKNDILIGWRERSAEEDNVVGCPYDVSSGEHLADVIASCSDCNADIQAAMDQLILQKKEVNLDISILNGISNEDDEKLEEAIQIDWTKEEYKEIKTSLENFAKGHDPVHKFPCGMGKRKRKLVHYIAEKMTLKHWSEGKKYADKIVCVGKK
mmetsp:Transcript_22155/g.33731  ORF Transcript_22155/g.33731 Transcript_22155/m.33731 type:complete len:638 (-) Transcript_22155:145-2058(-)|eukprot:CAMPEP_0194122282 /NCGR_PEP_ID=MMETSP0150-20130528/50005_1 /TAXON_ID=122233 /ORGANISM="Chaetoceros debilis, Strain MM31A-1" /LENGTH=637 /DNA_ID=CAMNT_0038815055 /DNA_START=36 /DNA_END=1949 /DNA_ORIENTATION=+